MTSYRVAFIGCGGISRAHMKGYLPCERTEVIAGMDVNPNSLEKWGAEFDISALYTDCDEMLKQEKPDIVSICTYVNTHCELVIKSAPSSVKAILCEKPMALNMDEANLMIAACDKHKVKLAIGHLQIPHERISVAEVAKLREFDASVIPNSCKLSWPFEFGYINPTTFPRGEFLSDINEDTRHNISSPNV